VVVVGKKLVGVVTEKLEGMKDVSVQRLDYSGKMRTVFPSIDQTRFLWP
jgi:hypothetical protein